MRSDEGEWGWREGKMRISDWRLLIFGTGKKIGKSGKRKGERKTGNENERGKLWTDRDQILPYGLHQVEVIARER